MIRRLTPADAEAFWHLRLEALQTEPRAFGSAAEDFLQKSPADMVPRFQAGENDDFTLGAFADGKLVAIAGFSRSTGLKVRHSGGIWGVYVASSHRGQGLGRALMVATLAEIERCEGVERVTLSVSDGQEAARRLYVSLGFVPYGFEPEKLFVDGKYVAEEHLVLKLR